MRERVSEGFESASAFLSSPLIRPILWIITSIGVAIIITKFMKMHMMSHVKVCSSITYHILPTKFGEFPIELYVIKLIMGFQQQIIHLAQINNYVEDIMRSISLENP